MEYHLSPGMVNADHVQPRRTALSYINKPITFSTGQFAGQCIRAELIEVQKADLGRKYARVDRRPLDPPPVVLLRLFRVYSDQSEAEVEDYGDIHNLGIICTADLFPVSESAYTQCRAFDPDASARHPSDDGVTSPYTVVALPDSIPPMSSGPKAPLIRYPVDAMPVVCESRPGTVALIGTSPITASSKCTDALVGTTFVQPHFVDYQGSRCLLFTFADLSVKIEGYFCLRYRVFDIFAKVEKTRNDVVVQAECFGVPFRIYSTKDFPGLAPSTELTKHLWRWGVRVNLRAVDRKRHKKKPQRGWSSSSG